MTQGVKQRRIARPDAIGVHRSRSTGEVFFDVVCWCERRVMRVPKSLFDRGLTLLCSAPDCHRPAAAS